MSYIPEEGEDGVTGYNYNVDFTAYRMPSHNTCEIYREASVQPRISASVASAVLCSIPSGFYKIIKNIF